MKKFYYLIIVTVILGLVLTGCSLLSNVGQVPTTGQSGISTIVKSNGSGPIVKNYGDVPLSGGFQAGHFSEVWDLTACDMIISFTYDANGLVDDFGGGAHAWAELGIREVGYGDFNPTWMVEGAGVWLATDYEWSANTFDPDPPGSPTLDLDDKMILQKGGGQGEGNYNLPSSPPNQWANHAVWFDRDGVDQWQAGMWGAIDGVTYNTGGTYDVVITLHATSDTTGEAYMTINGEPQGFYDPGWHAGPADLMPAGMTFTGDMKYMQVFYGLSGYGATHSVVFEDITVTGCPFWAECEVDLIAGQHTDVGSVIVGSDAINLYVTYETEEPWLMDEIHFHAASYLPDSTWPVTKKGNPIPGHFDWVFEGLEGDERTEKTFTIPIPGDIPPCGDLYFAAHAKVYNPEEYETLWQIGDVEEKICGTIDIPLFSNYADEFNWVGADTCTLGPGLSGGTPLYANPFIISENDDSEFPFNSNASFPYAENFDVQWEGETPFGGRLILSWAPGTGTEIKQINISDNNGNSYSFTEDDSNIVAGKDESIFNSVLVENILEFNELKGEINFNFVQTSGNGTAWDWIRLEKYREETAWGEGYGFPGAKNWSMYFECDNLLPDCSE